VSAELRKADQERPPTARVFFALRPPDALAGTLADVARDAAERLGGRPTRCDTIHLTLAFLGDVPVDDLPVLQAIGDGIQCSRFALRIDRLGYWPHKRLLWAGMSEVPDGLRDLHRQLQGTLAASGYRSDTAAHGFAPHITLVRHMPSGEADSMVTGAGNLHPLDWPCSSFLLFKSELRSSGPDYGILRKYSLA